MSLTVLVVDDEPIARHAVIRLLRDDADVEILGECGDGVSAVNAIRNQSPDLVFLDIQMPAITGMDVVATIGAERMPATVFVTAYEQYAVKAFEANAVDYLVKPFSLDADPAGAGCTAAAGRLPAAHPGARGRACGAGGGG
jgi:two-component system LytT family response regulator